jgi:hypothetical protein
MKIKILDPYSQIKTVTDALDNDGMTEYKSYAIHNFAISDALNSKVNMQGGRFLDMPYWVDVRICG